MTTTNTQNDDLLKPSDLETPKTKTEKTDKDSFTDKELKDLFGPPLADDDFKELIKPKRPSVIKTYIKCMLEVILA